MPAPNSTQDLALTPRSVLPFQRVPDSELLTIDQMAERLAMSRKQFQNLVRREGLPKIVIGHRTIRFAPETVIAVITERFTTAGGLGR